MASNTPKRGILRRFLDFQKNHPALARAGEQLGAEASQAGPLDKKTIELIRLAIAVGAREEGAVHSHTRRAIEAGARPDEIRHTVLLSSTSIGFPNTMAAMSLEDVLK